MYRKFIALLFFIALLIVVTGCNNKVNETSDQSVSKAEPAKLASASQSSSNNDYPMSSAEIVVDKLEVYYFHRTARCNSCNTMGQLLTDLMTERYSGQVKEGKIDFRQINIDLPENKEVAQKFRASGSSLFINRISNNQDKIEQDANTWRYLSDEENFNKYLSAKIDSYLGL